MKKIILALILFILGVSPVFAEEAISESATDLKATDFRLREFDGRISAGYRSIKQDGNRIASEYEYIKSSPIGALDAEWDPLPQRFVLESYYLNSKDYFGEFDYAYRDVVLLNAYTRGLFHNLNHYTFGPDDPLTASPTFTDLNPGDFYGAENQLRRAFIRFKTPDFPFHLYAEVKTVDREGTMQQRFLKLFDGSFNKVSESRNIDWDTQEVHVGANSHLGPVEVDYNHMEKKFESASNKILFDVFPPSTTPIPHNLVPDLESSSDTVKLHTTYSGRLVLSGTYTSGDKKNDDSNAKLKYKNAGGDFFYMPVTSVILALKYRHYNIDATNPALIDNVTTNPTPTAVHVRDAISSTRDIVSGTLRYRATDRLTVRGEYALDTIDRTRGTLGADLPSPPDKARAFWWLPESTTKNTARVGFNYGVMSKMTLRGDYSYTKVTNPAYDTDPDKSQAARASITWLISPMFNTLLSYSTIRESRDELGAPLSGGSRDAARDQALASFTMLAGNRSSLTVSYAYFKNKVDQTLNFDTTGTFPYSLDPGDGYNDVAHTGSVSLTVAPGEGLNLTASANRTYLRGDMNISGRVPNTGGIAELTSLKAIDTVYAAGVEIQYDKSVSGEIRYQYRHYDDQLDNTQDGTSRTVLATVSMKW